MDGNKKPAVVGQLSEKLSQRRRVPKLPLLVIALLIGLGGAYAVIHSLAASNLSASQIQVFDSLAQLRPDKPTPSGGTAQATIVAAKNEYESFQVLIKAGSGSLSGVRVDPDAALTGPGGAQIPAGDVMISRESNYNVTTPSDAEGGTGQWPDALIPEKDVFYGETRNAFPVDVAANGQVAAWVDVLVPANQTAGDYSGSVKVSTTDGSTQSIPVHLRVSNFSIPSTSSLTSMFPINSYDPCQVFTGDIDCNGNTAQAWQYSKLFAEAGLNDRISVSDPGPDQYGDTGGQAAPTSSTAKSQFQQYALPLINGTDPGTQLSGAALTSVVGFWSCPSASTTCLSDWKNLATQDNFASKFYVYLCDEPYADQSLWASQCKPNATRSDQVWPGVNKLITTNIQDATTNSGTGIMNTIVPLVNDMDSRSGSSSSGTNNRAAYNSFLSQSGNKLWLYTSCRSDGCGSGADTDASLNGWPGYVIDAPASEQRAMGWMAFDYGASGELYYNTTADIETAWTNQFLAGGNGDGTLFYPGTPTAANGGPGIGGTDPIPLDSIRLKRIRDGREDYEYLKILNDQGKGSQAQAIVQSLFGPQSSAMFSTNVSDTALQSARCQLLQLITGTDECAAAAAISGSSQPAADTTVPTASITAPAASATVSGATVTVSANAADNVGVAGVQFKLDGKNLGSEDTASPYTTTWDTTSATNGAHTLTAVARDAAGNTTTSSSVTVTVSNSTVGGQNSAASIYWGAWISGETYGKTSGDAPWDLSTWDTFEQDAGKKVSIDHFGQPPPWEQAFAPGPLNNVVSRGAIPFMDMDSDTVSLSDVASGKEDSAITTWAKAVKSYGKPFFFRWDWEMNGTWFQWGAQAQQSPSTYVAAWKHIHDLVAAQGASNVTWVWCPNTEFSGSTSLSSLYPGDSYVDWTCMDAYNWGTNPLQPDSWKSFSQLASTTYADIEKIAPGKPMMVGETASTEIGGSKASWITNTLSSLPTSFPNIKAFVWFNWNIQQGSGRLDWPIESSPSAQAAFASAIASPTYASNSFGNLPPLTTVQPLTPVTSSSTPTPPADTTKPTVSFSSPANNATVSGVVTATATASDNVAVSKVEFYLDGSSTPAISDTAPPYNYSVDSKTLSNGNHTITAKAYDAAGNTSSAIITLNVSNPDTTPPSTPSNVKATATNATTVNLTWNASTDSGTNASGIATYNVLRNGIVIAQSTTTSYTDQTAIANTSYSYVVQAVDGAGNVSANSSTVTVTTPKATTTNQDLLFNGTQISDYLNQSAPGAVTMVPDPAGSGQQIFKMTVSDSDVAPITPTENPRAQLGSGEFIPQGSTFWLSTKIYLPSDFPTVPSTGFFCGLQVYGKPYAGSPPWSICFKSVGNVPNAITWQRNDVYDYDQPWAMPIVKGQWVSVLLHEQLASNGFIEMWVNGQPVTFFSGNTYNPDHISPTTHLTMQTADYTNNSGPNAGELQSYRQLGMFNTATLYEWPLKIGTTQASVDNDSSSGGTTPAPDTTPPTTPSNVKATATSATQVNLSWNASTDSGGSGLAGYNVYRNGSKLNSSPVTTTSYGDAGANGSTTYSYTVEAVDGASNVSAKSTAATVTTPAPPDTTPPTTPSNVKATAASATQVNLSWSASTDSGGSGLAGYNVYRNGSKLNSSPLSTATYSDTGATPNTAYTYKVEAVDNAGNLSPQTSGVSVTTPVAADTTAPSVSITAPASGSTVSGQTALTASASDNVGVVGVQFKVDGTNVGSEDTASPYTSSWDTISLTNGTHTLTAVARDAAGNTKTSSSVTVTVDNSSVSGLLFDGEQINDYSNQSADGAVTLVSDPAGSSQQVFKMTVKNTDVAPVTPTDNPRAQLVSDPVIQQGSTFWLSAKIYVPSDFPTVPSNGWFCGLQVYGEPFDGSPPWSVCFTGSNIDWSRNATYRDQPWQMPLPKNQWVSIVLHEKLASDGFVEMWVNGQPVTFFSGNTNNPNHISPTTHLAMQTADGSNNGGPNTGDLQSYRMVNMFDTVTLYEWPLKIGSTQASVDNGTEGGGSTTPPADTTNPTVSVTAPVSGSLVSGIVTATASAADNVGVSKVDFYADGASTPAISDTSAPYNYSFDSKVLSNGSHTITAKAYDAAGNTSSATSTFTVNNPDTTPPSSPMNVKATASNATTVNLSWNASTDSGTNASGVAKYNVLRDGIVVAQVATTSYTDTSAVANTVYSYTIQAVDGAGNTSASSTAAKLTTPTAPDTSSPSTPSGFKAAAASATQINLTWSASTDSGGSGLAGYNVYRDGVKLNSAPVTSASYGDSTVAASTTYTYKIEAVDGAGNKSAQTSGISVTTPDLADTIAPTRPTDLKALAASATQINLTWSASTDSGGSGLAGYNVYRNGVQLNTAPLAGTTYNDASVAAGTTYKYSVQAVDGAGNTSDQSHSIEVTTPAASTGTGSGSSSSGSSGNGSGNSGSGGSSGSGSGHVSAPISITVTGQHDRPVAGAIVTVAGQTARTNSHGVATFASVPLGKQPVSIQSSGTTVTRSVKVSSTKSSSHHHSSGSQHVTLSLTNANLSPALLLVPVIALLAGGLLIFRPWNGRFAQVGVAEEAPPQVISSNRPGEEVVKPGRKLETPGTVYQPRDDDHKE